MQTPFELVGQSAQLDVVVRMALKVVADGVHLPVNGLRQRKACSIWDRLLHAATIAATKEQPTPHQSFGPAGQATHSVQQVRSGLPEKPQDRSTDRHPKERIFAAVPSRNWLRAQGGPGRGDEAVQFGSAA